MRREKEIIEYQSELEAMGCAIGCSSSCVSMNESAYIDHMSGIKQTRTREVQNAGEKIRI